MLRHRLCSNTITKHAKIVLSNFSGSPTKQSGEFPHWNILLFLSVIKAASNITIEFASHGLFPAFHQLVIRTESLFHWVVGTKKLVPTVRYKQKHLQKIAILQVNL